MHAKYMNVWGGTFCYKWAVMLLNPTMQAGHQVNALSSRRSPEWSYVSSGDEVLSLRS